MPTLDETVAALADRVQRLEDELAIHRAITAYGLAADVGDADAAAATFTPDGIYDVDIGHLAGRDAIAGMLRGANHQAMVGHCAHQLGPAVIHTVDATGAIATGYSRVYLATRAGTHIYRVSMNRWELVKQNGRWLVARRITRRLGHDTHDEAIAVLTSAPQPSK